MSRKRALLLVVVTLLLSACGSRRSHQEVIRPLTREYQKLTELLKLVESPEDAKRLRPHIKPVINRIVNLTEELESLGDPPAEEKAEVEGLRNQLDSAMKACRNRLRRALRIEGVPGASEYLQRLPLDEQ